MKRKTIWMLLLLIGAASNSACKLQSSDDDTRILDYFYRNSTRYAVEIIGYSHADGHFDSAPSFYEDRWMISPATSVNVRIVFGEVFRRQPNILMCDSVKIVFDAQKVLTYRNAFVEGGGVSAEEVGTIYDPDRYVRTEIDKRRTHFLYEITEADYEQAVEIGNAPASGVPARPMQ